MGRERATTWVEIWGDADFRDLTDPAQALWHKLHTHPALNYCGVTDFHPGRLAALTREQTPMDVMVAAQELSSKWWCVFDQTTDEVLVRGWLRHDGLLKQPRLAVSLAKAYAGVGSNKIRAVIVNEVLRYRRENPDLPAWEGAQMKSLLKQTAVPVQETETELSLPFGLADAQLDAQAFGQGYDRTYDQGLGQTSGDAQTSRTPAPTPTTAPATGTNVPPAENRTDISDPTVLRARAKALRVDFEKVAKRLTEQAGDAVPDSIVLRLIVEIVTGAKHRDGDRTGLVLTAIRNDWAKWSRLVFEVGA